MSKSKHTFWIAICVTLLLTPVAQAEEATGWTGWFEALTSAWENLWSSDETPPVDDPATPSSGQPGDEPELGPIVQVGG